MKFFAPDSAFSRFMTKVADLMILNLLFLVFSFPLFTIGASTTALYRCLLTFADGRGDRVVGMFWSAFRTNFKKATLLLLCALPAIVLTMLEARFYLTGIVEKNLINFLFFSLPILLVACVVSFIFPLQAQFENTIGHTFKNAAIMALMNFFPAVTITLVNLITPIVAVFFPEILFRFLPLWIVFGFALPAWLNVPTFRKIFSKYAPEVISDPGTGEAQEERE